MRGGLAAALLALLLTGCSWAGLMMGPATDSWRSEVMGLQVVYKIVPKRTDMAGAASWFAGICTIAIANTVEGDHLAWVAAHELAHCIDGAYLGWSSNGFRNEGCVFGRHFCAPHEGYAEAWARRYMDTCGFARSPLGLLPEDWIECELPDPRSVTPETVPKPVVLRPPPRGR